MDATFFSKSFVTIFSLQTQQIGVRLVAIKSDFFSRSLPLILTILNDVVGQDYTFVNTFYAGQFQEYIIFTDRFILDISKNIVMHETFRFL